MVEFRVIVGDRDHQDARSESPVDGVDKVHTVGRVWSFSAIARRVTEALSTKDLSSPAKSAAGNPDANFGYGRADQAGTVDSPILHECRSRFRP